MTRLKYWERELSVACPDIRFFCYKEVSSTMDVAREHATTRSDMTPCFILAEEQTAGRGRLGRKWDATTRGLSGTFVFFTENEMSALQGYSLVVGCAVAAAVEKRGISTQLKWPNDILLPSGKKAGGILIEILKIRDKLCVLTGIGLNLVAASTEYEESGALFVDAKRDAPTVCELSALVSKELLMYWKKFEREGFLPFRPEWSERAAHTGSELHIESGQRRIRGLFTGVDEHGNLTLEVKGQREVFPGAQIVKDDPR